MGYKHVILQFSKNDFKKPSAIINKYSFVGFILVDKSFTSEMFF
jgi:hypothetical protein